MATNQPSSSEPYIFTIQLDERLGLTGEQLKAIEKVIQDTIAEQIATLSITATTQPLLQPEELPDPDEPGRHTSGLIVLPPE